MLQLGVIFLLGISSINSQCFTKDDVSKKLNVEARTTLYKNQLEFTLNLFNVINEDVPNDNIFFSPFSVYHALLLGYFAAGGQTEKSLKESLRISDAQVVHVTSFPREKPSANLTEINLEAAGNELKKQFEKGDFKLKNLIGKGNFGDSVFFLYFTHDLSKRYLEDQTLIDFLKDPKEKFDAVIIEWFFSNFFAGIAPLFECPLIWFGSTEAHWQILEIVDEIPNPSYNVDIFSVSKPPLNFWERVTELYRIIKKKILTTVLITPLERQVYDSTFSHIAKERGVSLPPYDEAIYNGSLLLINSHPSIGSAFNLPQNAKYIGGYHINKKVKPLPKDLQKIMDDAKHGVVYFSMGSNLKSADMSEFMKNSLLKVFGKLKQTVIWKFEDNLDNVPSGIHLVKWAPQEGILAHPNLKFFITHGGQLSTTEAIHFAVPVIGLPVAADQHVNMKSVESKGFGISVKLAEDMADDLYEAIQKMLNNPSYKAKAKELSLFYHDRQQTPGDELVFWVQHVVRTRGASHLRSAALIPFYQKYYLDLLLIVLTFLVLCTFTVKYLLTRKVENSTKMKKVKTK